MVLCDNKFETLFKHWIYDNIWKYVNDMILVTSVYIRKLND